MEQLSLCSNNPPQINVDGLVDRRGVQFIGLATQMFDGTWRCLANVGGAFCLVEVSIQTKQL